MKWNSLVNITFKESKFFIFFSFLIIIISIILTLYNISILKDNYKFHEESYKQMFLENKKSILKLNIRKVIDLIIKDGLENNIPIEKITQKISKIRFENNRYIFIFVHENGSDFMTPIVNPNRPDWVGKKMHLDKIKDHKGNTFMKSIIKKMSDKDELYSVYNYKEPNSDNVSLKLSYIKKYPELNWYIGSGLHFNYMDSYLEQSLKKYKKRYNEIIYKEIIFAFIVIFIFSLFLFVYNRKFYKTRYELNQLKNLMDNIKKRSKVWYWIYDHEKYSFDDISKIKNFSSSFNNLKDLFSALHPNDYAEFVNYFEESLKNQKEGHIEFRLFVDNKIKYFEYTTKKIYNDATGKIDLMGIVNDKTEQKTIELNMLKRKISETNGRIEKDINKIINMISHQWRHPISYINSKLIDVYLDDFDKEKFIEDIESSTEFMSETIDDFIEIMDTDSKSKEFYLIESIEKIIKIFESELIDIDIKINVADHLLVKGDRSKFSQVFLNMLNNSLEAFKDAKIKNKTIMCHAVMEKGNVNFIYKDNAGGISKDKIDKVFDLFYSTKANSENKGLGLYIMKVIIEEHLNGKISMNNIDDGLEIKIALKPYVKG